jgi:hypothetical protein
MDRAIYDLFRTEIRGLLREREQQQTAGATVAERDALQIRLIDAFDRLNAMAEQQPADRPVRRTRPFL